VTATAATAPTPLERFERDGFLVLEDALAPDEVETLTAAVDRVWREESPDRGALHLLGFVGRDAAFVELVDHPAVLPLVLDLLGWNVYVYHSHLDVHPPAAPDGRWRWHQDGGRQNVDVESPRRRLSVKVAWFLTDTPAAGHGALRIVPGSHRSDTLSRAREPREAVPLLVRAGSAVLFDRRLWHARGDNVSAVTRKALFYAYSFRWVRPRDDLGLRPGQLAGLDPVRRQLLGAGASVLGRWLPTDEDVPLRQEIRSR
jgi:ectoine hydroxylase-related dioxygenase (phytanoyl-CoA dioxygenase family)